MEYSKVRVEYERSTSGVQRSTSAVQAKDKWSSSEVPLNTNRLSYYIGMHQFQFQFWTWNWLELELDLELTEIDSTIDYSRLTSA